MSLFYQLCRHTIGTTEVNYAGLATDASGFFTVSVGSLAPGNYDWRAKGPRYLANAGVMGLLGGPITNQEMGLIRAGDANNDNLVSAVDFNILRTSFGGTTDLRADFNNDGIVSAQDFNLLRGNFGQGGAPPISPSRPRNLETYLLQVRTDAGDRKCQNSGHTVSSMRVDVFQPGLKRGYCRC